jgi:hypothetical protein
MKTNINGFLQECIKAITSVTGSAQAAQPKNESLKRLNEMRLRQLSSGWGGLKPEAPKSAKVNDWVSREPTYTPPMPTSAGDSFSRLDAFIASRQLVQPEGPSEQCQHG